MCESGLGYAKIGRNPMLSVHESLGKYLRHIGQFEPPPLGKEPPPITSQDSEFLREIFDHQIKFNNCIIIAAVGLLICLFSLGVFLILYNLASIRAESVISGATFRLITWNYLGATSALVRQK